MSKNDFVEFMTRCDDLETKIEQIEIKAHEYEFLKLSQSNF